MRDSFGTRQLALLAAAVGSVFVAGTVGFHYTLHEGWIASFYRAVVSSSLTGLDSVPRGVGPRLLTIALVLSGVAIFAYVGAVVVEAIARGVLGGAWAAKRRRRAIDRLRDHTIICGYGRVGRRAAEEFRAAGQPFVVLDFSADALDHAREHGDLYVEGSGTEDEDLAQAGLDRARGLIASSDSDADNLYITLSARSVRPDLTIVARASDEDAEKKLRLAGADRVVTPYATAGRVMANLLLKPQVSAFLNVLSRTGGEDISFEEIEVKPSCPIVGRSIRDLRIRDQTGAYIVAHRAGSGDLDTRPSPDAVLHAGDVVVGVGTASEIGALEDLLAPREPAVARGR
jgi:voltage-gated potassium channel